MPLSRRELLTRGSAGVGVLAVGNLTSLLAASPAGALQAAGLGPLQPDPNGLLDLPAGFAYTVISRAGDAMPGGGLVPERFDGTAAFPGHDDGTRLVVNHELGSSGALPTLAAPDLTYDAKAKGGTTTLTLDKHNNRVDEYVSLAGTWSNCAGGLTPWGTWLTCEETEVRQGTTADRDHGFVFEVDPANAANNVQPTPLTAMGRFPHEAVALDPRTGDAYLTEDAERPPRPRLPVRPDGHEWGVRVAAGRWHAHGHARARTRASTYRTCARCSSRASPWTSSGWPSPTRSR